MGLIGHWRRSVLGAGGVALLLPLGLILGVALTTALGGGPTLRALGQVLAGPSEVTSPAGEGLEAAARLPAVPVRARPSRSIAPAGGGGSLAPGPAGAPAPGPSSGPGDPAPGTPSPGPGEPPGPSAPGPSAPPPPSASPGPAPAQPDPAGEAAGDVAEATGLVPGPAGDAAGSAVTTVVDLLP